MSRDRLLQYLVKTILSFKKDASVLVGLDGIDASGKTFLADQVASELQKEIKAAISRKINSIPEFKL